MRSSSSNSSSDEERNTSPHGYFSDFDENYSSQASQNAGFYWKGKDYINTYKEDTKEPEKFSDGIYTLINKHKKNFYYKTKALLRTI